MLTPRYPALYQLNTRVRLTELSLSLGHAATLDDITDAELDRLVEMGFDWLWLLSVLQTGPAAQRVSRSSAAWRHEFEQTLPDLREEDIAGSGFAITRYTVHRDLGGDEALARLRTRARQRGLRLMLDFVPNPLNLIFAATRCFASRLHDFAFHARPPNDLIGMAPRGYVTKRWEGRSGPCIRSYV